MKRIADLLGVVLLYLFGASPLHANPVTYHFDDTGYIFGGGSMGVGQFTLDIGSALGEYTATGVSGGPGSLVGSWTSVAFGAHDGQPPTLAFLDAAQNNPSYFNPFVTVSPGDDALLLWENLRSVLNASGVIIVPIESVPDGGPTFTASSLVFVALLAYRHKGIAPMHVDRRRPRV